MKKILLITFMFVTALVTQSWAQDQVVSGKITSAEDGSALPGVNVVLKGTTTGTTSDIDGNFKLSVPSNEGILIFSFIGLSTQEITVGSKSVINVTMAEDAKQLSEVVVTALGVERDVKALGYAVQNVNADDINKAREANIVNSLSGKVAGVHITNSSGAVGGSSRIILRGATSITGNNEPLFVVDGVPINNDSYGGSPGASVTDGGAGSGGGFDSPNGAADINPDDIASISVLKGANAAALYGARAANGVVLITTKTGKGTKGIGVSFNSSVQFDNTLKLPSFQNSYGQGGDQNYFNWVDGSAGDGGVDESWGPPLDVGLNFVQFTSNGQFAEPWVSHPDNVKDFFETGVSNSNNIALTGGYDKGSFRLSLGNSNQTGIVPNTEFKRTTINIGANLDLTDKLTASFSANYINSGSDNLPTGGYNNENPVQQFLWSGRQVDFTKLKDYESLPLAGASTGAPGTPINWNTRFQNNPYWALHTNLNKLEKDRLIGNVKIAYKLTDWLTAQVRTGTDTWSSVVSINKAHGSNNYIEGFYEEISRKWYQTNSEILLMMNKNINDDFSLAINLGGNQMKQRYRLLRGTAPQLELEGVFNLANVKSGVTAELESKIEEKRINSIYGSANLSFRDYLFLDITARNDWFSVLPTETNSVLYPSVSMSAIVSDIAEMQSDVLSFLKVRGSWAQVGSDGALDPYKLQQPFRFRPSAWGAVLLPFNHQTLNNPFLKAETTTSLEFGLDARFFNGRVNLEVTYYDSKTSDLLVPAQVSSASGYTFAWDNTGEMTNKGIELQLGARVIEAGDFAMDIDVNWAKSKNEVVKLNGDLDTYRIGGQWSVDILAKVGEPYGAIFGPAFLKSPDGDVIHKDGLPVIDPVNRVLGNIQPDWTGGINTTLTYKGITLSALVDAKIGGDLHSMTYSWGRYAGVLEETLIGRETGIIGKGVVDNGDGTFSPNTVSVRAETYNKAAYSKDIAESAVFDASYAKLRQIQFGYTLPNSVMGKLPFKDVSISIVGRNLAILYSKIPHIDPESAFSSSNGEQGQEFGQLPSTRSIGFNINFKL